MRCDRPIISGVSINLEDARKPLQYLLDTVSATTKRVGDGHPWRRTSAPRSVITSQRPEVSGLGLSRARIEDRGTGLVHESLHRSLQVCNQSLEDRTQFEFCSSHPVGNCRAVKIDVLSPNDLGLAIYIYAINQNLRRDRFIQYLSAAT